MLNNGGEVDACFFDFSKAFDKVDHRKLVKKLVQIGVDLFLSMHVQYGTQLSQRPNQVNLRLSSDEQLEL